MLRTPEVLRLPVLALLRLRVELPTPLSSLEPLAEEEEPTTFTTPYPITSHNHHGIPACAGFGGCVAGSVVVEVVVTV